MTTSPSPSVLATRTAADRLITLDVQAGDLGSLGDIESGCALAGARQRRRTPLKGKGQTAAIAGRSTQQMKSNEPGHFAEVRVTP